jgi:uncharacterized protein with PQ loop repeat
MTSWEAIATVAGGVLPLFDIPLIYHVIKRRRSNDISRLWAMGLWLTSIAMAPAGIRSGDWASKAFNIVNVIMLTIVVWVVFKYRQEEHGK